MTAPKKPSTSPKTTFAFDWLGQVARDGSLIKGSYRLAMILARHLWELEAGKGTYYTKQGQKDFALEVGVERNTVQKLLKDLIQSGHLGVTSRKGQGVVNYYTPILKAETCAASGTDEAVAEPLHDLPEMSGTESLPEATPSAGVELFDPQASTSLEDVPEEDIYALETNSKYDIEALRNDPALVQDTELLSDLFDIYLCAFPHEKRDAGRHMSRVWFLELIHRGYDPSQVIGEAREYVRAAQLSEQPVRGPLKWVHSRVMADSAERRSAEG